MTGMFLVKRDEKHVRDADFLVVGVLWLHAGLNELGDRKPSTVEIR
jgi:hypothetical protein